MRIVLLTAFAVCAALTVVGPAAAQQIQHGEAALRLLAEPRSHAILRHAIAPGTGDPADFTLGDCATQRNLDERGREQARAIGAAIRAAGIDIDLVLTSQWCRSAETARLLGLGPVREEPALNSFFADRSSRDAQTAATRALLAALPPGETAILVSHQVNITALTGIYPRSGEMVILSLDGDGAVSAVGRFQVDG